MALIMSAVNVGASLSLSGRYALQGRQAFAGLRAWREDVNASGGLAVPGRNQRAEAKLVVYDDQSRSVTALANTQRLIEDDRVDILIGPYASDLTRAVVRFASASSRVVWNHGGSSDDVQQIGGRAVGVPTPASHYYDGTLSLLHRRHPDASGAAVVFKQGSPFGRQILKGVQTMAGRVGLSVRPVSYLSLRQDMESVLSQLKHEGCDLVLSARAFQDEILLARALLRSKGRIKAMGFVAAGLEEFGSTLGQDADQVYGPSQWEEELDFQLSYGPKQADVARSIRRAGGAADYTAAQSYATGLIVQRCLEIATDLSDDALWCAAGRLDCTTFFGRFKIDPASGLQLGHEMVTVQWQDGQKRVVWPTVV